MTSGSQLLVSSVRFLQAGTNIGNRRSVNPRHHHPRLDSLHTIHKASVQISEISARSSVVIDSQLRAITTLICTSKDRLSRWGAGSEHFGEAAKTLCGRLRSPVGGSTSCGGTESRAARRSAGCKGARGREGTAVQDSPFIYPLVEAPASSITADMLLS